MVEAKIRGAQENPAITQNYETIILKPHIVDGVNIISQQDISGNNKKFVIKWGFTLVENLVLGTGCIIDFDGGFFTSGEEHYYSITGNDTRIILNQDEASCLKNVYKDGTWLYPEFPLSPDEFQREDDVIVIGDEAVGSRNLEDESVEEIKIAPEVITRKHLSRNPENSIADNDDLTVLSTGQLQLANKAYSPTDFSGLGRVYLRKNIVQRPNVASGSWLTYIAEGKTYLLYWYNNVLYNCHKTDTYGLVVVNHIAVETAEYDIDALPDYAQENSLRYTESGGIITITLPDDTTITASSIYDVTLYPYWSNVDNINLLTQQMISQGGTIYYIQYDFDLYNGSITIPANCILYFVGGSIHNGTLVGTNTILVYDQSFADIISTTIEGSWIHSASAKPDEEDVTDINGKIKFKDKAYNAEDYSGLGRKYLRKNIVDGINTLTQAMINAANTIYIIQYDYELAEDITIPANCILKFEGGSIKASGNSANTINGNHTCITAGSVKIFNTDVILAGTWDVVEAYSEWFGAKGDGNTNDTNAVTKVFGTFNNIKFLPKTYLFNATITRVIKISGTTRVSTAFIPYDKSQPLLTISTSDHSTSNRVTVENIGFNGLDNTIEQNICIKLTNTNSKIDFNNCIIDNFFIGFYKETGNIENNICNSLFRNNSFAYYVVSTSDMHAGCDYILNNLFLYSTIAAVYIDTTKNDGGDTFFVNDIFDGNVGFDVFVYNYDYTMAPHLKFESCWFENQNVRTSNVTINGNSYECKSLYFRNSLSIISNCNVINGTLVNSIVYFDQFSDDDRKFNITKDSDSFIFTDNYSVNDEFDCKTYDSTIIGTKNCAHIIPFTNNIEVGTNPEIHLIKSIDFNTLYSWPGQQSAFPTLVHESPLFDNSHRLHEDAFYFFNTNLYIDDFTYKYTLFKAVIKPVEGSYFKLGLGFDSNLCFPEVYDSAIRREWCILTGCSTGKTPAHLAANMYGASILITYFEVVQTDSKELAIEYLNNSKLYFNRKKSGESTDRPTSLLYTGFKFFDTTLGKPIYWNGTAWVDATGTTV